MKPDIVVNMDDSELRELRAQADELLKAHDEERKAKALAEARALRAKTEHDVRALLASVGLSFKDLTAKRTKRKAAYKSGHLYQHPTNGALVWKAKGQKPKWLRELEAEGGKVVEIVRQ